MRCFLEIKFPDIRLISLEHVTYILNGGPRHTILDTKMTDILEAVVKIRENRFTTAILENGRQRFQGLNLRWPYIYTNIVEMMKSNFVPNVMLVS